MGAERAEEYGRRNAMPGELPRPRRHGFTGPVPLYITGTRSLYLAVLRIGTSGPGIRSICAEPAARSGVRTGRPQPPAAKAQRM